MLTIIIPTTIVRQYHSDKATLIRQYEEYGLALNTIEDIITSFDEQSEDIGFLNRSAPTSVMIGNSAIFLTDEQKTIYLSTYDNYCRQILLSITNNEIWVKLHSEQKVIAIEKACEYAVAEASYIIKGYPLNKYGDEILTTPIEYSEKALYLAILNNSHNQANKISSIMNTLDLTEEEAVFFYYTNETECTFDEAKEYIIEYFADKAYEEQFLKELDSIDMSLKDYDNLIATITLIEPSRDNSYNIIDGSAFCNKAEWILENVDNPKQSAWLVKNIADGTDAIIIEKAEEASVYDKYFVKKYISYKRVTHTTDEFGEEISSTKKNKLDYIGRNFNTREAGIILSELMGTSDREAALLEIAKNIGWDLAEFSEYYAAMYDYTSIEDIDGMNMIFSGRISKDKQSILFLLQNNSTDEYNNRLLSFLERLYKNGVISSGDKHKYINILYKI
ncbi:MAG: hypothetical protein IJV67_02425 [Clostridia bacterium]|nr:hypothetical protein [Clostridia bacterium]